MKYEEFYERLKTVAQANLKKIQDEMLDDSVCREYTAAVTLFSTLTFVYLTICLPIEPPISWLK